ncbi:MAG: alpha-D-ribose 1-methylphosphonate 5-triphosphate diphosphatase [Hyphomicrobiaceae bacterium]
METVLTNARLILEDEVVKGTVVFGSEGIRSVDQGVSALASAIDAEGDYVAPGLVEMHTDNLEKHFIPRPAVIWPNGLAAALAHDAQMAAAGVSTVYDAICAGYESGEATSRRENFERLIGAIKQGTEAGVFRIDHKLHLRCELSGDDVVDAIEPHIDHPLVALGSLMDHTPGQRQWRDLAAMKTYVLGKSGKAESEWQAHLDRRLAAAQYVPRNWPIVAGMFRDRAIPLASHDDTTAEHVEAGRAAGVVISEFPTTLEAARAAKAKKLATIAGAPNVVRGGSHSGGVSVAHLAEEGVLDGLSSDYVPASLLQAVERLSTRHGVTLPRAIGMVTWAVCDALRLTDRGRLKPQLRADILRFRFFNETPVVRALWCDGRQVL